MTAVEILTERINERKTAKERADIILSKVAFMLDREEYDFLTSNLKGEFFDPYFKNQDCYADDENLLKAYLESK